MYEDGRRSSKKMMMWDWKMRRRNIFVYSFQKINIVEI